MQCLTIILYGRKFWRIAENMSFGRIYFWRLSPSYNDIHSKMANRMRWEFDREFDWSFTLMSACGGSDLAKQG